MALTQGALNLDTVAGKDGGLARLYYERAIAEAAPTTGDPDWNVTDYWSVTK